MAIFSLVSRYAPADAILNATLPTASSGKVRKVTSASGRSSSRSATTTPSRVSVLEISVTTPSVTRLSRACTSLVRREISTPGLFRVKKPIDMAWRWV